MLTDRAQALLDSALRIGADDRRRPPSTGGDGFGAGLFGGVLLADPAAQATV